MKKVAYENSTFDKLECVIGDFNDLKVPDNSLDFVLDLIQFITLKILSLHLKKLDEY